MAEPAPTPLDDPAAKVVLRDAHDDLVNRLVSNQFTADDVKEMLIRRRDVAAERLVAKRNLRDKVNGEIRELVAEYDEAERLVRALEPKTRKKAK